MKRMMMVLVACAVAVGVSSIALAADPHATEHGAKTEHSAPGAPEQPHAAPQVAYPHPTLPGPKLVWPGTMLIWVGLMFFCAMIIGPLARMEMPPEVAPHTHSHDEPPGSSGHHGHSGTIQPGPEHDHH